MISNSYYQKRFAVAICYDSHLNVLRCVYLCLYCPGKNTFRYFIQQCFRIEGITEDWEESRGNRTSHPEMAWLVSAAKKTEFTSVGSSWDLRKRHTPCKHKHLNPKNIEDQPVQCHSDRLTSWSWTVAPSLVRPTTEWYADSRSVNCWFRRLCSRATSDRER